MPFRLLPAMFLPVYSVFFFYFSIAGSLGAETECEDGFCTVGCRIERPSDRLDGRKCGRNLMTGPLMIGAKKLAKQIEAECVANDKENDEYENDLKALAKEIEELTKTYLAHKGKHVKRQLNDLGESEEEEENNSKEEEGDDEETAAKGGKNEEDAKDGDLDGSNDEEGAQKDEIKDGSNDEEGAEKDGSKGKSNEEDMEGGDIDGSNNEEEAEKDGSKDGSNKEDLKDGDIDGSNDEEGAEKDGSKDGSDEDSLEVKDVEKKTSNIVEDKDDSGISENIIDDTENNSIDNKNKDDSERSDDGDKESDGKEDDSEESNLDNESEDIDEKQRNARAILAECERKKKEDQIIRNLKLMPIDRRMFDLQAIQRAIRCNTPVAGQYVCRNPYRTTYDPWIVQKLNYISQLYRMSQRQPYM